MNLKNLSPFTIRPGEFSLTYQFTVLDSSGRPAPLTEAGKVGRAKNDTTRRGFFPAAGPVASFDLPSGATRTSAFRLQSEHEIKLGEDYTVQVRYLYSMPKVDGAGKPITDRELIYTLKAKGG